MWFKYVLFYCLLVMCNAQNEGDQCTFNGQPGICVIYSKCYTAIRLIKLKKTPQMCGFVNNEPIVCCIDQEVSPGQSTFKPLGSTTTVRQDPPAPSLYVPPEEDYIELNEIPTGCAPVPPELTSPRTGQTAFDKCLEYQERFVYPCEKGVTLTEDMHRANRCHHDADELFNGFRAVKRNEFPHFAMLGIQDDETNQLEWLCGGTIISENFVLTAAHCYNIPDRGYVNSITVDVTKLQDRKDPNKIFKVKRGIPHPNFKAPSKYHDIALLETDRPIELNQFVMPACLDVGGAVNDSNVLAVTWGSNGNIGWRLSNDMLKVTLQKFSAQVCSTKHPTTSLLSNGFDPLTQTCYAPRNPGQDTCQGDSGSAILIKSKSVHCMYIATGITSYGRGCGDVTRPALYTRVVTYMPWIESIVWP